MFIINFPHWGELDKSFLMRQQQRAGGAVMRCYKPIMRLVVLEGFNLSLWASFHESVNEHAKHEALNVWLLQCASVTFDSCGKTYLSLLG